MYSIVLESFDENVDLSEAPQLQNNDVFSNSEDGEADEFNDYIEVSFFSKILIMIFISVTENHVNALSLA